MTDRTVILTSCAIIVSNADEFEPPYSPDEIPIHSETLAHLTVYTFVTPQSEEIEYSKNLRCHSQP
jgi:hypothetical protein